MKHYFWVSFKSSLAFLEFMTKIFEFTEFHVTTNHLLLFKSPYISSNSKLFALL